MENAISLRVGARIREIRVARGMTLEQVGGKTGLTKGQVGKIEQGAPRTSPDHYAAIAAALGVALADLFVESPRGRLSPRSAGSRKFSAATRRSPAKGRSRQAASRSSRAH